MASTEWVRYNDWLGGAIAQKLREGMASGEGHLGEPDVSYFDHVAGNYGGNPLAKVWSEIHDKYGANWNVLAEKHGAQSDKIRDDIVNIARKHGVDEVGMMRSIGWKGDVGNPLPQFNDGGSLLSGIMGVAEPFAKTAGVGLGLGAAGGALGLAGFPGVGAVPSLSASFGETLSGLGGSASAGASGAAGGASAAGGSLMPAAIPPVDPTFGGALTQVAPGVWSSTGIGTAGALAGGAGLAPAGTGTASAGGTAAGGAATSGVLGTGMSTGVAGIDALLSNPQVLGMTAGALMGGLDGGSSPAGTTTSETDMPDWLKAYVKPALDKYSTMVQNYNTDPYGVMPAAMDQFKKTVSGGFLDPSTNKYLENYFNAGAERVKGTLSPSFGHMQAFGGHSGYNEALSRGLGDLATGLYGQAYENERSRMNAAIGAAPSFLQQSSQQAFAPYQGYLSTLGSLKGSKTTQPYFQGSDWQNILGGAMTGWGLGNIFKN